MRTNRIAFAWCLLLAGGGCVHPTPTYSDYDEEEYESLEQQIEDAKDRVTFSMDRILDDRATGFAKERVGQPVTNDAGFLQWAVNDSISGFDTTDCTVRARSVTISGRPGDLYVFYCEARLASGSSDGLDFEILTDGISSAMAGRRGWTSEKTERRTRYWEPGSLVKPFGNGDVDLQRVPYDREFDRVSVTIWAAVPEAGT